MIIDYKADPAHAEQYEILDAMTWQPLPMDEVYSNIVYADDQSGILRIALKNSDGMLMAAYERDPQTPLTDGQLWRQCTSENGELKDITPPMCVAWREERRPIRIVRKDQHAD